jgi:hypothetical protein
MNWPDMIFEPVNLPIIGSDPNLIPDADCDNCKWSKINDEGANYCYMFSTRPGLKCGQFKELK